MVMMRATLLLASICVMQGAGALVPPARRVQRPCATVTMRAGGLLSDASRRLLPVVAEARLRVAARPLAALGAAFFAGLVIGLGAAETCGDAVARYRTVEDIPARRFRSRSTLAGVVVKVADGDTLRARHTPPLSFLRPARRSKAEGGTLKLSEETLQIRLYAVDTPETAKFGNKGEKYGDVAKDFTADRVTGRTVRLRLLSRDQYGRAVAVVRYGGLFGGLFSRDLSEELLKAGLAAVYRQGGAEYDGKAERFEKLEAAAKAKARGAWADGGIDPAAYKRALKAR